MPTFRFSHRAEDDLLEIGLYTLRTWGEDQVGIYLEALEACCQMLADNPELGRACEHIRPGLRSMAKGRHTIFYRRTAEGIWVSRILHQRMMPERHAIDEEESAI